jgi:hypothetical protein
MQVSHPQSQPFNYPTMIELYYRPTPDGHNITLFLEETDTGMIGDLCESAA